MIKNIFIILLFVMLIFAGLYLFFNKNNNQSSEINQTQIQYESTVKQPSGSLKDSQSKVIVLSKSKKYSITVPPEWSIDKTVMNKNGVYILDQEGKLLMKISWPIHEIGYEGMRVVEKGTVTSSIGNIEYISRIEGGSGFARYNWYGKDFWNESFEITVPFRKSIYPRSGGDMSKGEGYQTVFTSFSKFEENKPKIEELVQSINLIQ